MAKELDGRALACALYVVCFGVLMIVLDTTIVTVALPTMLNDLDLSSASLTWVLNAYLLSYSGFLLLGGRLGDLYGRRRLFLSGIGVFTAASVLCALARTEAVLLLGRAVQGIGAAVVSAVSLSLILNLFQRPGPRAKALAIYGIVCAAGGGAGELLGGIVTQLLGWQWIFLVNIPIGVCLCVLGFWLLPPDTRTGGSRKLDVLGSFAITAALTLSVYALASGQDLGWTSRPIEVVVGISAFVFLTFIRIEMRVSDPVMPLRLFQVQSFATANLIAAMWAAGTSAWLLISALYLQRVLGYDPLKVGLAFLPAEVVSAAFSAGLSARIVSWLGVRVSLAIGLLVAAAGLALFARAPIEGHFAWDVLPPMVLVAIGASMASTPLLLAAMSQVGSSETGLASGVVNTSFMMGGALGLAILGSLADARARDLQEAGLSTLASLDGGYHYAFLVGALVTLAAAVVGAIVFSSKTSEMNPVETIDLSTETARGGLVRERTRSPSEIN